MTTAVGPQRPLPQPFRPALYATAVLLIVGIASVVLLTIVISVTSGISPLQVLFAFGVGTPLFLLAFVAPVVVIQGAIALALRSRPKPVRIAGLLGALAVVVFCLLFIVAVAVDLVALLTTGGGGDPADLLVELCFGVPLGFVILLLNGRAAWLEVRSLRQPSV
jgi:hypothetical protein